MAQTRTTLLAALNVLLNLLTAVQATPKLVPRATGSLDTWLSSETSVALDGVLDNIGSSGAYTDGVSSGIVIASPSKVDPDCTSLLLLRP